MDIKKEVKGLMHPYYLVNILLSLSYLLAKCTTPLCNFVFAGDCEIEMRQTEIFFFLLVIIMIRARKTGSMGLLPYLSNAFMYCKAANIVLWFVSYKPYGVAYILILLGKIIVFDSIVLFTSINCNYFHQFNSWFYHNRSTKDPNVSCTFPTQSTSKNKLHLNQWFG